MASSINASTSGAGGVITTADNSGILNLQSGGVTVATISPSGIQMASNTAPAFYAYRSSSDQSITSNTYTKIQFNSEVFDTNNNFDSSTNYRFTPTVAGYYQLNIGMYINGVAISRMLLNVYKNGVAYMRPADINAAGNTASGSVLVYMNGSTDYVEGYAYVTATNPTIVASSELSYFQGFLARSA